MLRQRAQKRRTASARIVESFKFAAALVVHLNAVLVFLAGRLGHDVDHLLDALLGDVHVCAFRTLR